MNVTLLLRVLIILSALIFVVFMVKDCYEHREEIEKEHGILFAIAGFILCFFDTFGIGNMATSMAFFRLTKTARDDQLSGTGNVAFCVTTISEFVIFSGLVKVDSLTLVSMIVSAIIGSLIGANIVTRWSEQTVRKVLGVALLAVAVIMVMKSMSFGPFKGMGTALGLRGWRLAVGIIGIFFLGALQTMGIGMFATTFALVSCLGMDVSAAFPIMMGACGFVMPWCSIKFVKEGKYQRKASLIMTVTGIAGVAFAAFVVKSMSTTMLMWAVVVVLIYTACTFFKQIRAAKREQEQIATLAKE